MRARREPRTPRDPDAERQRIESREIEQWIDEGEASDLREEAAEAAARAGRPARSKPRATPPIDPEVAAQISAEASDRRVAERMISRLGQAQDALDHDRLDEARRVIGPIVKTVPGVAAVHEVSGLVAYRLGRWRDAVRDLEAATALKPNVELLPVLADSYRALRRWTDVDRVWLEIREASPAQAVLAEGRIVAAGALADRGDLAGAIRTMGNVPASPKRVRDHHLRLWYVLGDLHDRAGNTLEATRWFERVSRHDADFVDVAQRLRSLGRR
ncbi:tetratricopeptide repeat protein [Desertimonas flava]|uniref:tetratricopeptide repeat protein n=1 Tax=Desertimonas flava TaxID=2064846 RepID=UPI0023F2363A|nr:hypothetical protein [Desertimonas flava]